MDTAIGTKKGREVARAGIFLLVAALVAGVAACPADSGPEPTPPVHYSLTISSTEGGSVTTPGEGTGSFTYDEGTVVDLTAEPHEGYRFVSWTGDVSSVADVNGLTTIITMNGDYSIIADFAYGPAIPLQNPGSFVQMTTRSLMSLDPTWLEGIFGCEHVQYIYETLLYYDREQIDQFLPVLATEWELLDDNVTYRFKIRDGVKFHEGGDLTPEDVEYSVERAMGQSIYGVLPNEALVGERFATDAGFAAVDAAVQVDGDYVVFTLSDAVWALPFLQSMCGPLLSIVDKEWCIANGEWDGTEETWEDYSNRDASESYLYDHANGTGPWKLEEWNAGVQIKLVRNDDYWRERAPFERVITQFVDEWSTQKEALLAGDVDCIDVSLAPLGLDPSWRDDVEELAKVADLKTYQDLPYFIGDAFFFQYEIASGSEFIGSGALDGEGIPTNFFTDADVRKGFCYAFDYETYIEDGYQGQAQRVGSPIYEGVLYFNPDASMYSLDLAKAEEHLRAAWEGKVWEKGFKFTLLHNGTPRRETSCRILAENLYAINSKFQVSVLPTQSMLQMIGSRTNAMHQGCWEIGYPHPGNIATYLIHSGGNFAAHQGYRNPELDQLIEDAFNELDPTVQEGLYYEIQERYYEDAPSIMLGQLLATVCFTKYVDGFYYNQFMASDGGLPLYYMGKSSS